MKNIKFLLSPARFLCALLAVLMLMMFLPGCKHHEEPVDTTVPEDTTTTAPDDDKGFVKDDVPEDVKFPGKDITVLSWEDVEHEEFYVDFADPSTGGPTGEIVKDAIYSRNLTVQDRLGITLKFLQCPADSDSTATWLNYVRSGIESGDCPFDIMAAYSLSTTSTAANGLCRDLLDEDCRYLDTKKPWYPDRLLDEATINNRLYFISGDMSSNLLYMMYVCFENPEIMEDYHGDVNIYELVDKNLWTYDKFIELCTGVYHDENGDGTKDKDDKYGYITSNLHTDVWFYGTGATIVSKGANDTLKVSDDYAGEKVINSIDKINNLLYNTDYAFFGKSAPDHQKAFGRGEALFIMDRARVSITQFDTEIPYHVFPCPKYDEQMPYYVTLVGNPFTLYAIPINAPDENLPMLSAFLEIYASESYRRVTPELFEVCLKIRYTNGSDDARMYDQIRRNVTFDIGRLFDKQLGCQSAYRENIKNNKNTWKRTAKSMSKGINKHLETLITAYQK